MPTPSDPISLGIAHQRLLCWGQGGARAAVSLLKLWWVRLGLEAPGTIPPLGTSLSREAGRGPVLVTAPHALAFGAFLVPFCLFGWCFSKYSPKKAIPAPCKARSTWRGILCPWLSGQELRVSAAPPGCWCHPPATRETPQVSSPFAKHIFIRLTSKGTDLFYFNEFGKGKWGSLEKQVPVRCGHTWAR